MRIETCILTAPRPLPTLYRTIHSLRRADILTPFVMDGIPIDGERHVRHNGRAYLTALFRMFLLYSEWDMLLMVDDDTIFCMGVGNYLQEPGNFPEILNSVYSLYTPSAYSKHHSPGRVWYEENQGAYMVGGNALLYPRHIVKRIIDSINLADIEWGWDRTLGEWARANGITTWYHEPSLAQHIGMNNSSLTEKGESYFGDDIGRASTFPGEDASL